MDNNLMACPHCNGQMTVTPELRGQVVTCPHCQQQLTIPPAAPTPPPMPPQMPASGAPYTSYPPQSPTGAAPQNYLVWAILSTICCCLPLGIVAIVYAAQVDSKFAAGDYAGAQQSSDNAKQWCWIAFGVGLVLRGGAVLLQIAAASGM